jgi:hypothetical protein
MVDSNVRYVSLLCMLEKSNKFWLDVGNGHYRPNAQAPLGAQQPYYGSTNQ